MIPLVVVDDAVIYKPDNLIACTPNVLSVGIRYATCLLIIFIIPTITIAVCNVIVFKIARSQYAKIKADAKMVAKFKLNMIEETHNQITTAMHSTIAEERHEEVLQLTDDLASKKVETSNLSTNHKLMDVQLNREENESKNKNKGDVPIPESQQSIDVVANMQSNITSCKKRKKSTIIRGKLDSFEEENISFKFNQNYKVFVSTLLLILVQVMSQIPFLITRIINLIDKTLLTISASAYITTAFTTVYAINPLVVLLSRKDISKNLHY